MPASTLPRAAAPPAAPEQEGAAPLEWQVHLARGNPARAAVVAALIGVSAWLCLHLFQNGLLAIATILVLLGATAEFLFPIHYRLTAEAAEFRNLHTLRRIAWTDVRKAYRLDHGVYLSPFERASRLDAFRGVLLRFSADGAEKEAVLAAVRAARAAARQYEGE